jgi:hypothetical protein
MKRCWIGWPRTSAWLDATGGHRARSSAWTVRFRSAPGACRAAIASATRYRTGRWNRNATNGRAPAARASVVTGEQPVHDALRATIAARCTEALGARTTTPAAASTSRAPVDFPSASFCSLLDSVPRWPARTDPGIPGMIPGVAIHDELASCHRSAWLHSRRWQPRHRTPRDSSRLTCQTPRHSARCRSGHGRTCLQTHDVESPAGESLGSKKNVGGLSARSAAASHASSVRVSICCETGSR